MRLLVFVVMLFSMVFLQSAFSQLGPGDACWAYGEGSLECQLQNSVGSQNPTMAAAIIYNGIPSDWTDMLIQTAAMPNPQNPSTPWMTTYQVVAPVFQSEILAYLYRQRQSLYDARSLLTEAQYAQWQEMTAEIARLTSKIEAITSGVINWNDLPEYRAIVSEAGAAAAAAGAYGAGSTVAVLTIAGGAIVTMGMGGYVVYCEVIEYIIEQELTDYCNANDCSLISG
jgi:hypothetical protein